MRNSDSHREIPYTSVLRLLALRGLQTVNHEFRTGKEKKVNDKRNLLNIELTKPECNVNLKLQSSLYKDYYI